MPLGITRLKRTFQGIFLLTLGCAAMISCANNNYYQPTPGQPITTPISFRAFVSNPLSVTASGAAAPGLNIIDAQHDLMSASSVDLSAVQNAGMMALSPDRTLTLVASPTTGSVAIVNNGQASLQSTITLPGVSQSMFIWVDNATGFAAVPTAPVSTAQGPAPGAVFVMNLSSSSAGVTATIPVVGARYIVESHNGNRILAFGSNSQTVTVISTSQIATSSDPRAAISSPSFDHPVWGIFSSDDTTAYVLNCGPECGGSAASVAVLDMTQSPPQIVATIPVPAATYGLLTGANLYVAGTSATGGGLSVISVSSNTVENSVSIPISDGYHNRMQLTPSGQLFIGARGCGGGCLSIFNTATSVAVIPQATGDVTGIQPITGRTVVYVCQNGVLNIYDTTTDALQATQLDVVGQAVDVELPDTP